MHPSLSSSFPSPSFPSPLSAPPALSAPGWDDFLHALFTEHAAAGLVPARAVRVDRGRCDVLTAAGPARAASRATACADPAHTVCTGDRAAPHPDAERELVALLPRRTAITRAGRARPVIALTKLDLAADAAAVRAEVTGLAPGVDTVATSATTGEGVDVLAAVATGTTVLVGPSGAGKSTLANALLGEDRMDTGAVRAADGKGRHTTVRRELPTLPGGGALIDTPGLRGVGLQDATDGVEHVVAEIEACAQQCAICDCEHRSGPGCAVQEAVAEGQLSERRLAGQRKLPCESEWAAAREAGRPTGRRSEVRKAVTRHQRATRRFFDRQR